MAQLRIRKKAVRLERTDTSWLPLAGVLAAGIAMTLLVKNGQQSPVQILHGLKPWVVGLASAAYRDRPAARVPAPGLARPATSAVTTGHYAPPGVRELVVNGKAWSAAPIPPITDFDRREMVEVTHVQGYAVLANRARGVARLGPHAGPFDRLYLPTGPDRYAALRWREVP